MKPSNSILLIFLSYIQLTLHAIYDLPPNFGCPKAYSYYFYEKAVLKVANQYRNYDGSYNNLRHPTWGKVNNTLKRLQPTAFSDYRFFPSGQKRPLPRIISNEVCSAENDEFQPDPQKLSGLFLVWGQFLSHDLHHTPPQTQPGAERWPIQIPAGDSYFDPQKKGSVSIQFNRSIYDTSTSAQMPRQQLNELNSWFDGQYLYGSDEVTANKFRTFQNGKLKLDQKLLLTKKGKVFVSGDKRVNQNLVLTALNTLFVREHNRICEIMGNMLKHLSDEQLYIYAKNYIAALVAKITYDDYLPLLLGPSHNLDPYKGYDKDVEPSITNIFSTAAFRFGHFTVPTHILKMNNKGQTIESIPGRDGINNPSILSNKQDVGYLLKGQSINIINKRTTRMPNQLRNFLANSPTNRTFIIDLAAYNIQRGEIMGYLTTTHSVNIMASNPLKIIHNLHQIRKQPRNVNLLDAFIGVIAQDNLPQASVGPLGAAVICETLSRVRAGDRFWYESAFPEELVKQIKETSLADIIRRNTQIKNISNNVFIVGSKYS